MVDEPKKEDYKINDEPHWPQMNVLDHQFAKKVLEINSINT